MRLVLSIALCLLLMSCGAVNSPNNKKTLDLAEANKKWNSNGKKSYFFDLSRTCECSAPYSYSVKVINGEIEDVHFEKQDHLNYESEEMIIQSTRTVDELFQLLEQYEKTADHFEVEFHKELGYPTIINVNPSNKIADEEIILEISNLVPLHN